MYEFVINSDIKTISQRLLYILYLVCCPYSTIFQFNKWFKHMNRALFIALYGMLFQIQQKIEP